MDDVGGAESRRGPEQRPIVLFFGVPLFVSQVRKGIPSGEPPITGESLTLSTF